MRAAAITEPPAPLTAGKAFRMRSSFSHALLYKRAGSFVQLVGMSLGTNWDAEAGEPINQNDDSAATAAAISFSVARLMMCPPI
jgi:hypothetical protein